MRASLRAAVLLAAGARAFPTVADVVPDEPRFREARAIQYRYLPEGISLSLDWTVEGGLFDRIVLVVDGDEAWRVEPGGSGGRRLEGLDKGLHRFELDGHWGQRTTTLLVEHQALEEPQVVPVLLHSAIFHGFDGASSLGALLIAWDLPASPGPDPYVEFEVRIDGKLFHRLDAESNQDNAVTVRGISEGTRTVGVTALSQAYASREALIELHARGLAAPKSLSFSPLPCEGAVGAATLGYQVPGATRYDSVGAWVRSTDRPDEDGWVFQGFHPVTWPPEVHLSEVPEGRVEVELAGAVFEDGAENPSLLSNLPHRGRGTPFGEHAIIGGSIDCGMFHFRRGDANRDGTVNLTDPVVLIRSLFTTEAVTMPCRLAADANDDEAVDITDPIRLLGHLFQGQEPPPPPGPRQCGEDPTPGKLG
ncbi:MAG: dockerin type I domain-containing protein, partial [Thermoanaerobaculia bacterium]